MVRLADRFVLDRELGMGGMATVFLARDEVLDRPVAVKILRSGFEDPDMGARFRREGRTAAKLSHPNIVQVYDAGEGRLDGRQVSFIVMEYVPGGDLKGLMDREGKLSGKELSRIGADLASGLTHAHERGVIHRDVKPQNVLLDEYGAPKLADFGIARAMDATDTAQFTRTGTYLGTALYSPPEQLRGEKVTSKSDLYSFGAALYHAAVGESPFSGTPIEVASQQMSRPPVPPRERGASIDEGLEAVILSCLAKDPAGRPDAPGVRARLLQLGAAAPAAPPAGPNPTAEAVKAAGAAGAAGIARAAKAAGFSGAKAVRQRLESRKTPTAPGPPESTISVPRQTFRSNAPRRTAFVALVAALVVLALVVGAASALLSSGSGDGARQSSGQEGGGAQEKANAGVAGGSGPSEEKKEAPAKDRVSGTPTKDKASGNLTALAAKTTVVDLYSMMMMTRDYEGSYALLSGKYRRTEFPSEKAWARDAGRLTALKFAEKPTADVAGGKAVVRGTVDVIYSNRTIGKERRSWTLVAEDDRWKIDGMAVRVLTR